MADETEHEGVGRVNSADPEDVVESMDTQDDSPSSSECDVLN